MLLNAVNFFTSGMSGGIIPSSVAPNPQMMLGDGEDPHPLCGKGRRSGGHRGGNEGRKEMGGPCRAASAMCA